MSKLPENVSHILAPNKSAMTLQGTNTWVIFSEDEKSAVLIDPGPAIDEHIDAFRKVVRDRGATLHSIILTHMHLDHSEALKTVSEWAPGVPVYAVSEQFRVNTNAVIDCDELRFGEGDGDWLRFLRTPGHTYDSLSVITPDGTLFTGDSVLGLGTTVVSYPDGSLGDYLASLSRLNALAHHLEVKVILPGHGPVIHEPMVALSNYLRHRNARLEQVRAALADGAKTPQDVYDIVYGDTDRNVHDAAIQSIKSQLEYLRRIHEA
ncbi:MBL fold metallo-hydrolase [Spelaeicoccus albus]|uniref:Glyoxylase-like metal-dependent hydrolase (Beta-lactamase superfamily II) n=1 Tax=Spelaeicoccus albus TaxID=1280376 RepID=A0A7Z0D0S1_9MICO|nr:MBL fold metallo-hydrolase [Spelaeicoccus albus]NYI65738.1 glyoxylase-like metal-dependent hydrolase (beta-lactamase superfamily II) [Spelaeicoccus albus]